MFRDLCWAPTDVIPLSAAAAWPTPSPPRPPKIKQYQQQKHPFVTETFGLPTTPIFHIPPPSPVLLYGTAYCTATAATAAVPCSEWVDPQLGCSGFLWVGATQSDQSHFSNTHTHITSPTKTQRQNYLLFPGMENPGSFHHCQPASPQPASIPAGHAGRQRGNTGTQASGLLYRQATPGLPSGFFHLPSRFLPHPHPPPARTATSLHREETASQLLRSPEAQTEDYAKIIQLHPLPLPFTLLTCGPYLSYLSIPSSVPLLPQSHSSDTETQHLRWFRQNTFFLH